MTQVIRIAWNLGEDMNIERESDRPGKNRRNYAAWRASALFLVYVLMAAHFVHWQLAGRTLSPVEFNEAMVTAEMGIVTAGCALLAVAFLASLVFGRFFCSWACHILALQDASAWLLERLRIKPKPVRSRALALIAPLALAYMFLFPLVLRWMEGRPAPPLRFATEQERWASFVTSDYWRNLPGPTITILTFVVAGFVIVYLLGTRSFCRYVCPYGTMFGIADRFAVGRLRVIGSDAKECENCGVCTAVCQSHVRVHEELGAHGMVVDANCLKDLDCVSVCPSGKLKFRFGKPSLFASLKKTGSRALPTDFSFGEEAFIGASLVFGTFALRGLYDEVPFLMAITAAACLAFLLVMGLRLTIRRDVRVGGRQWKAKGRLTRVGLAGAVGILLVLGLTVHSFAIRLHEMEGDAEFDAVRAGHGDIGKAISNFEFVERYGWMRSTNLERRLGSLYAAAGEKEKAILRLKAVLRDSPSDAEARLRLGALLLETRQTGEAATQFEEATRAKEKYFDQAIRYREIRAEAHIALAEIFSNDESVAETHFASACDERAGIHAPMAFANWLFQIGRFESAATRYQEALRYDDTNLDAVLGAARSLLRTNRPKDALPIAFDAVLVHGESADAHAMLANCYMSLGRNREAAEEFEAARLIRSGR